MEVALPGRVCVLDIETEKAVRGEVSQTPLAFVGIKIYNLHGQRYCPCKHRLFFPEDMDDLESVLLELEGIIVGHNILRFDYEVLKSHISLETIKDKTVDTFLFLYEKINTGSPKGGIVEGQINDPSLSFLSLDNLASLNFGEGKTISGKSIPKLWREGHRAEVIAYNEKDLTLTYSLWRRLVEEGKVVLSETSEQGMFGFEGEPRDVESSEADRLRLTGQRPLFNTRLVLLEDGPAMEMPPPDADLEWSKWYIGHQGVHYIHEDVLMIQHPMVADFAMELTHAGGPYPAREFDFKVEHEGPLIPVRMPKKDMPDLMEDM